MSVGGLTLPTWAIIVELRNTPYICLISGCCPLECSHTVQITPKQHTCKACPVQPWFVNPTPATTSTLHVPPQVRAGRSVGEASLYTGRARRETLYHRDGALLYIAYVMLIWAAPIPADRWHCSLWP